MNLNRRAISAERAKQLDIENEVIDLWVISTHASPLSVPDIIQDWYDGKINLIVDVTKLSCNPFN